MKDHLQNIVLTMRFISLFCAILLAFQISTSLFGEAVVFKFTNYVCLSYNESWFIFHNCRLKAVSRDKVILNTNGTILFPAFSIITHSKLFKKANGYKPWLFDTKVDACRFLKKRYDPFAKIVYGLFKEFSNINHTCPYVGLQEVRGFFLRPELLSLPIPSGDYMLSLRWYFHKKLVFDTNVSFTFTEDFLHG
ncbi:uncharacterized protein LOC116656570 isoform X1 [Drosophila ananassae]|nr:uncharacterized protein LOC26514957 isoform X1 [Drosophila ananassae]XP_032312193.1 uncharacterized protein LOC26514957 isoform X1 [Drosophila ananassae]XP_032312196.1 uncharacterized protein LOC116656570 isoform X1 [Drosophila ananassae]XP_032312197.1 uncharacterized protein LOC116656570 isoform X1 [Drosophila ananassae]